MEATYWAQLVDIVKIESNPVKYAYDLNQKLPFEDTENGLSGLAMQMPMEPIGTTNIGFNGRLFDPRRHWHIRLAMRSGFCNVGMRGYRVLKMVVGWYLPLDEERVARQLLQWPAEI